jgi:hypothetical protein
MQRDTTLSTAALSITINKMRYSALWPSVQSFVMPSVVYAGCYNFVWYPVSLCWMSWRQNKNYYGCWRKLFGRLNHQTSPEQVKKWACTVMQKCLYAVKRSILNRFQWCNILLYWYMKQWNVKTQLHVRLLWPISHYASAFMRTQLFFFFKRASFKPNQTYV